MSLAWKMSVTVILFAIAAVAAVILIVNLLGTPPTVDFTSESPGQPVNITLQSVGSYGSGSHPTWVSYLVQSPQGQWVHTTVFQVPADTRLNVTIVNYDSGSPLRNQQLGQVTGTSGAAALLNGKPFRVINSNAGNGVAHTFSMPSIGINVPLYGNNANANLCAAAPCTTKSPHQVIKFSFTTPGPGSYRWQCFVPCGLGFLFGNGGPMSTLGYMGGFMQVVGVSDPAAEPAPPAAGSEEGPPDQPHHWWRLITIWVVLSAVLDPLFYFLAGPHIPPGTMTDTAQGAQFDFNVLFVMALPVMLAVWIYLVYAIVMWRASRGGPEPVGGPDARGHFGIQLGWILTTTVIVLFLAGFGTYELVQPGGAGGGQGSSPIWTPTSKTILPIQVIGQQWKFTYRYPTFGGFETDELVVPDNTTIQFNVTSLDVIHSFWAYQLGVKADANPDYNNVAYTTTRQLGSFTVRCAELCGIWHGAMYNSGEVVGPEQFESWAKTTQAKLSKNTKLLPPYVLTYTPDANGADGGYYPDNVDPYSHVEQYGAKQVTGGG